MKYSCVIHSKGAKEVTIKEGFTCREGKITEW